MKLDTVIAANRYGLGARPGDLPNIESDPRGWLIAQVSGSRPVAPQIQSLPSSAEVFKDFAEAQEMRREARQAQQTAKAEPTQPAAQGIRNVLAPLYLDQAAARYSIAGTTDEPFRERLVHFWTNHFAVSADKAAVVALAGTLENEAIRPNIGGRFTDMLLAVEMHPAMIMYLDNQQSTGPHSRLAERATRAARSDRKFGINENLARETLELHTLGVDGSYTQTDVTTLAEALSGWSIGGGRGRLAQGEVGKFLFRDNMHEPGAKTLLGRRYREDGYAQAKAILQDLARHPATARHIATKLVRHFVADQPPAPAVDTIAKVFRDTDGHLPALHRALVELPQAWQQPFAKFKTPHEFVISTFRAFNFVPRQPQQVVASLQMLGQRPYTPGSPAGWPDTAGQWDGPDALMKRIEWANTIGRRIGNNTQPKELAQAILGPVIDDHTVESIVRAESGAQAVTLLLASPEFQRR